MNYLLDTNAISELKRPKPNENVTVWFSKVKKENLYLSVLTLGEIRKGVDKLADVEKKQKLSIWLEKEIPAWFGERLLTIDAEVADYWGKLQAQSKNPLPAIDSLLAATALAHNLSLVTRNVGDFRPMGVPIINPWEEF